MKKILSNWLLNIYIFLGIYNWKNPFRWVTIQRNLLDYNDNVVNGEIEWELHELPSNYLRTCSVFGCLCKYYIVKNINRRAIFGSISNFDKITYNVYTNIVYGGKKLEFKTENIICMQEQIDLQYCVLLEEMYNYNQ